jgi:phosphoadenosine phosphosulfate reductase
MSGPKRQAEDFQRWPKYREAYIRAFERMLAHRKIKGKKTEWKTGEDVMRWWLKADLNITVEEKKR